MIKNNFNPLFFGKNMVKILKNKDHLIPIFVTLVG